MRITAWIALIIRLLGREVPFDLDRGRKKERVGAVSAPQAWLGSQLEMS